MTKVIIKPEELFTPLQLARRYPDCGLTSTQIGYAFHVGAVQGIKHRGMRTSLISRESFERFLEYRKEIANFEVTFC